MHLFAVIFWIVSSSEGVNMGNGIMVRKHGVKQPKKWNIFTEQKMGDRPMGIFIFISKSQDLQGMPFFLLAHGYTELPLRFTHCQWPTV